ncbi:MAG TPA: hypothetical protein VGF22_22800 [Acidimicrobiales bacterium]
MPRTRQELEAAAARAADWVESLDVNELEWGDAAPLRAIVGALEEVAEAERRLAAAVDAARWHKIPWSAVGMALGTSGEAARQRFGASTSPEPNGKANRRRSGRAARGSTSG